MPPSTEAILPLAAQVSRTALTWAKRFAHSRLVMMITSSEATIAWCRFAGGAIGKSMSARPRRTCVSLFMTTGQAPRSTHDLGDRLGLVLVVVVGDDRDDVALLDREADVDDQRRVLQQVVVATTVAIAHLTLSAENAGSTSSAKRSTCPNWSSAPKRQMKWSTPRVGEGADPLGDLVGGADRPPVGEVHRLRQLGVVLGDVVAEGAAGPRPRSRRCSSSPGRR